MSQSYLITLLYLLPVIIVLVLYYRRHHKKETHYRARLEETKKSAIPEPLTLHPGIDTPQVKPTFETNVPGIFIAGELGGMGLIRKGVDQGARAMETIRKHKGSANELDVVIVGAGPAGISASLAANEAGLRCVTIEQENGLGGS